MSTFKKVQSPAVSLYTGLSASGNSMIITPYPVDLDGNKLTMAALGDTPQVTVDARINGSEEIIGFTGIIDNGNNSATVTGLQRDLASSTLATPGTGKAHGSGASVIFSWNPQDVARLAALENNQTFTGLNTFSQSPTVPTPVSDTDAANKKYVSDAITGIVGTATTTNSGTVELATQAEVDAKTSTGSTGPLVVNPANVRGANINDYVVDTGAADAYAIAPSPAITAYAAGQTFIFKAAHTNTTASTLAVSGLASPKTIKKYGSTDLVAGDIAIGQIIIVVYDGTNFQMKNHVANAPLPLSYLDTTTTLGTSDVKVPSQNAVKTYVDNNPITTSNGVTTRDLTTASGTQTIAHGLGRTPKKIKILAEVLFVAGSIIRSTGIFNGTTTSTLYDYSTVSTGTGNISPASETTNIIHLGDSFAGTSGIQVATVSVDSTNITLSWTKTSSPTGTAQILWEAQ